MPLLNPFSSAKGMHFSLFEIRLENDFIVFRGSEHESAGQLLKGTVVLCLTSPLRVEDVHLRLAGTLRHDWTDNKPAPAPGPGQNLKVDRTVGILSHSWPAFVGGTGAGRSTTTLPAGNYEWPFEYTLPGNTAESVEGIAEASITYRLKATISRGKLAHDAHAYRHLRVIRTPESSGLELLHIMSVENTWPDKLDYSIVLPQKAVAFGSTVPIEMRFTPLLKGLDVVIATVRLVEIRDYSVLGPGSSATRDYRIEREVSLWQFKITREEHWRDLVEGSGQDGWVLVKNLPLPKKLRQCLQDLNHHGIKIRHKVKLTLSMKNPDGHYSELRATLPLSIFISPSLPLDEHGDLVDQALRASGVEACMSAIAPPVYGKHVLDQLYDDLGPTGFCTPGLDLGSGTSSPQRALSRANSAEDLSDSPPAHDVPPPPAALSSMLADLSPPSPAAGPPPPPTSNPAGSAALPSSAHPMSRRESHEDGAESAAGDFPEHLDYQHLPALNKVPSYGTAVKTPARSLTWAGGILLPNYESALGIEATAEPAEPEVPLPSFPDNQSSSRDNCVLASLLRVSRSRHHHHHNRPGESAASVLVHGLHPDGSEQHRSWRNARVF